MQAQRHLSHDMPYGMVCGTAKGKEQTMSDTIYRQEAIDAIYEHEFSNWCDKDEVSTILYDLPSADRPQEWIDDCISRQQAIDALIEWYGCKPDDIEAFEEIIKAIPSADRPQEWIPCSERLPKRQGHYICTCKDGSKYKRTTVVKWSNGWQLTGARAYWIVLAWMPLPEPWKGADDE